MMFLSDLVSRRTIPVIFGPDQTHTMGEATIHSDPKKGEVEVTIKASGEGALDILALMHADEIVTIGLNTMPSVVKP